MACLLPICFCELDYTLSRKEFPLEQYNYLVTVWCIFSCDSSAAYCSEDEKVRNFKFVKFKNLIWNIR